MREIKFRAYHENFGFIYSNNEAYHDKRFFSWPTFSVGFSHYADFNEWKISQYTGLKDCNGKEIYEGDIVTWGYGNTDVKFGTMQEWRDWEDPETNFITGWIVKDCFLDNRCEVIGNIYETPELLEK